MADVKLSPWKRGLRTASFRGVQFHVRDRDFESGRRIALHEFPKRDTPFPEDMGKAAREFDVDAYVMGDDYMSRRNALIKACERTGPGSYVDFWGMTQRVVCRRVKVIETNHEGRMCRLRIDLVEAGGGSLAPVSTAATASQLATAASGLVSSVVSKFASTFAR